MTSHTGKQIITMYIYCPICKGKSNQTMKFDKYIEYKMRNWFLKIHTQNVVGKLVPKPLLKN